MISVCLATYNGESFIKEQIQSILPQLQDDDEIVISDDYSNDSTLQRIKEINDARIRIVLNEGKKGYSYNFENALRHSIGDIIYLSDQDDVWFDDKVEVMNRFLLDSDMAVCNATITDVNLVDKHSDIFDFRSVKPGFIINFVQIKYLGCTMAFRRTVLDVALPFPNNQKLLPHDSWLTLVGELFFRVKLVPYPLMYYRRHESNVSNGGGVSRNSLLTKVHIRLYSLICLFFRAFRS